MQRYSILTGDLSRCIVCGGTRQCLHEVFYGTANRKKSIEWGLVVPLCNACHNMSDRGVHFNKELDLKLKEMAERKWLEYYNKSIDDFIKEFGRNVI